MDREDVLRYKNIFIIIFIAVFTLFALWMRLLPQADIVSEGWVNLLGNDPWYKLRQVEQTVVNFPAYGWFDAMTEYPTGNTIHWGSLSVYIISLCVIIAGASTRPEIMYVASWVPPLMAAAMVPLMYLVGRKIADWKVGLFSALFIAVVSGQYFYRSLFGFVDHHIAEVLFSTLFAFAYLWVLAFMKSNPVDMRAAETLKKPVFLSALAGIAYLLGLFVMPTMILFALIVAVYTAIQFISDVMAGNRPNDNLLVLNVTVFAIAIVGLLIFGIHSPGSSLVFYTVGHIAAYLTLIFGTAILYGFTRLLAGKPRYYFALSLIGTGIIGAVLLAVISPALFDALIGNFWHFFGESATTLTIQEARPWTFADAWSTFHFGLIMMVLGFGAIIYTNIRENHPEQFFVLVWSFIILLSTIRHIRYEYYLGVNIALLSAFFVGIVLDRSVPECMALFRGKQEQKGPEHKEPATAQKTKKKKGKRIAEEKTVKKEPKPNIPAIALVVIAVLLAVAFSVSSVNTDISIGSYAGDSAMNSDWRESLEWMAANTPETGLDYYAIYDADEFEYPEEAYGVMSWWDYGHWITFIAQRIPNANPFQHGVSGPNGAASFFIQPSEEASSLILDNLDTQYVVTDIEMDIAKFWAMATWYNTTAGGAPYQQTVMSQNGQMMYLYSDLYFNTMISRLHNFDGSLAEPIEEFGVDYGGKTWSYLPVAPLEKVPALTHYRLVHESSTNVFNTDLFDLKYVKVFEYVPGAHITGEGIIQLPIKTNTGRSFVYRQESVNGEFVVPYSTTPNPSGVTATGLYTIEGTDLQFEVTEEAVKSGLTVN